MSSQGLCEVFDKAPHFLSIVVFGKTTPGVLLKSFKPGGECSVLLDIVFHNSWHGRDRLYTGKENSFFGIVVVMHRFRPALTICQEVSNGNLVGWKVVGLKVDGVQAAEDAIMGQCHLGGHIVRCMGGLAVWLVPLMDTEPGWSDKTHIFRESSCRNERVWFVCPLRRHVEVSEL